jgi:hypothetical protein
MNDFFLRVRRLWHRHGFGVQSPSAYNFIRDVIEGTYPYYDYSDLEAQFPNVDNRSRKLAKLYFRIANVRQPKLWISCQHSSEVYRHYIQSGCKRTHFLDIDLETVKGERFDHLNGFDVACINLSEKYFLVSEKFLDLADQYSILIFEKIHSNSENRNFWNHIVTDSLTCVTFDLYYCGIVFFDHTKSKQNFIVNF